jgi:hypothetical protein
MRSQGGAERDCIERNRNAITQLLQGKRNDIIVQRLPSDCDWIAKKFKSNCKPIAMRFLSDCAVIAQQLSSLLSNNCSDCAAKIAMNAQ